MRGFPKRLSDTTAQSLLLPVPATIEIGQRSISQSKLFLFFLCIVGSIPILIHAQWITGPLVNAILILTYLLLGLRRALFIAFIPSIAALTVGMLPFVLAPIIPFIITGNLLLVITFHLFKKWNFFVTLLLAAAFKFIFLYWAANMLAVYILPETYLTSVITIFGWHQFSTAIVGGLVAFTLLKGLLKDANKPVK